MVNKVPEGWKNLPLVNLAYYHNGRAFKPADLETKGLPVVRIGQLTGTSPDYDFYSGDDVNEKNLLQNGDLIFSWSATLMVTFWNGGPAILNQHLFKVVPKPSVDHHFLKFVLENSIDALADASHGSTMRHIRRSELKFHHVNVPPLPEQKKIAAILSSVDEAIEATEAVIEQTRTVKRGLLQELLTRGIGHTEFKKTAIGEIPRSWKVYKLGEVAPFQTGYPFKSNEFSQQGDRLLRGSNVGVGTINWSEGNTCFFPTTRRDEFRQYLLKDGDVVIGMDRPFINDGFKTAQIQKNDLPALLLQRVGRFLPISNEILLDFVGLLAESKFVQGYLQKTQKGMDLPHISKSEIENCLVPIPPKNEQIKIADQISSIKNSIRQNNNSLTQYYQLKKGLLQDLLTGKVRVNTLDLPALLNAEAPAEAQAE
ncbi:restriction endonuclease subunit S [Bradymonas sediminis]|uniref:Restriction endonuclease subunit S n=1 Tax=Bradymonas sediminis TaxID=1548548 RepID=A0A2Z4FHP2_9DELT|nr:restriction endonuclease subunit S [Bradymonas sediminis]AWV88521.1 restriction endonuclease subunit S [Bradymonas sediminis]TDP77658.1 type I restriction enzyme S subunit [Bradymonas sediminis]